MQSVHPSAASLDLFAMREQFDRSGILLCFNGPITSALIEELGLALRRHLEVMAESPSAVTDVFSVYVEVTQNIRRYAERHDLTRETSVIVVSRDLDGRHDVSAGNVVRCEDGAALVARVAELGEMDAQGLRQAFKTQIRRPRSELEGSAGLGLIDMARRARAPLQGSVRPIDARRAFFTLRVAL